MSFIPKEPPSDNIDLYRYLVDLEQRIFEAFQVGEFERINLKELYSISKINDGDVINSANDLGSGTGIYHRKSGAYVKL